MHGILMKSSRIGKVQEEDDIIVFLQIIGEYRRRLVYTDVTPENAAIDAPSQIVQYAPASEVAQHMKTFVDWMIVQTYPSLEQYDPSLNLSTGRARTDRSEQRGSRCFCFCRLDPSHLRPHSPLHRWKRSPLPHHRFPPPHPSRFPHG